MKKVNLLFGSILSGVLFTLAWPAIGDFNFLIFFAFIPLLWVESQLSEKGKSALSVFLYAYLAFFVFNISTTWWIKNADLMGAIMAILCNSFFMATVFWLFHFTKKHIGKKEGYIGLIIYWLAFEYLHLNWELSWTWLTFGNAFATSIKSIQWYEYTGVLGGSLWVLAVNVLLFLNFKSYREMGKVNVKSIGLTLTLMLVPILIGRYIYSNYEENGESYEFVVVQPNIDPYHEKFGSLAPSDQIDKMINLAKQELNAETDYLIFPETAIPEPEWEHTIDFMYATEEIRKLIADYPKLTAEIGMLSSVFYPNDVNLPKGAYSIPGGGFYENFNTSICIDSSEHIQIHHKSKLVLGVEKVPFLDILPFMKKLSIKLGGSSGQLGSQEKPSVFKSIHSNAVIAPIICYESIYGEYVTQYTSQGANLFTIITNEGWWGDTPGYKQHLAYASLRAIENRRSIARSANTGTSAFINQKGEISQTTAWWTNAVIKGEIKSNDKITFYVKYGDYIGRTAGFVAPLLLLLTLVRKMKKTDGHLTKTKA